MIKVKRGSKNLVWISDGTPQEQLESDLAYLGLRIDEIEERSYRLERKVSDELKQFWIMKAVMMEVQSKLDGIRQKFDRLYKEKEEKKELYNQRPTTNI